MCRAGIFLVKRLILRLVFNLLRFQEAEADQFGFDQPANLRVVGFQRVAGSQHLNRRLLHPQHRS